MAVRLDKDLRATIDKVVASYNRKIAYYEKKGIQGLPSKTSYQDIIELGSRKNIMKELNLLSGLNKKTVDRVVINGKLVTVWEKNYIETKLKGAKRLLKGRIKKLANMELKQYGKATGFTMGDKLQITNLTSALNQGRLRSDKLISNLRKYNRISNMKASEYFNLTGATQLSIQSLVLRVYNPFINKDLKDNYLESLTDLGYAYGYDKDKLAEIEKKLKGLTDEEFGKLFTEDLGIQKVFSYYDIMKINLGSNVLDNKNEVFELYDNLYDNLDEMIGNIFE